MFQQGFDPGVPWSAHAGGCWLLGVLILVEPAERDRVAGGTRPGQVEIGGALRP